MTTPLRLLVSLIVSAAFWALIIKLAARIYRHTNLSWKHALQFALLLFVVVFGLQFGLARLKVVGNLYVGFASGLVVILAIGGWFLKDRAFTQRGERIGLQHALALSTLFFLIVAALGLALAGVMMMLTQQR
ncbi:MAG: hypothetical protein ABIT36_04470 [Steroidobacteraceae bacterium]